MDSVREAFIDHPVTSWSMAGVATVATIYGGYLALQMVPRNFTQFFFNHNSNATTRESAPPGTVVLYQIMRGTRAPSLSPFPVKLEMFLRLAKIPYVNDLSGKMSSKSKTPWISLDGVEVADSQLCIEYLNTNMKINLNTSLSQEQKAVSRAFQVLVDEHLYWTVVYFRWIHDPEVTVVKEHITMPAPFWWYARRKVVGWLHAQGLGRHSHQDILGFMLEDLGALDGYLGDKRYLMGNDLTEVDCSAFGMLCQFVYMQKDDILKDLVKDKFPKLQQYTHRVKEAVWPDWEDIVTDSSK